MATEFTERERQILAAAWQCFNEEPKIDFGKLANIVGMTNPKSATNAWRQIKTKLAAISEGKMNEDGEVAVTPKATPKRKRAGNEVDGTPAKKKGKATPKKEGKKADADEENDDEDDSEQKAKIKEEASEDDLS